MALARSGDRIRDVGQNGLHSRQKSRAGVPNALLVGEHAACRVLRRQLGSRCARRRGCSKIERTPPAGLEARSRARRNGHRLPDAGEYRSSGPVPACPGLPAGRAPSMLSGASRPRGPKTIFRSMVPPLKATWSVTPFSEKIWSR